MSSLEIQAKAISVTLRHMRKHGFERVRLSDVAKDLGMSHAALYSHFADKATLLDAVSAEWVREVEALLQAVCADAGEAAGSLEPVRRWCVKYYQVKRERAQRDPELYRAFDQAAAKHKPFVLSHLATMHRQLAGLLAEARAVPRSGTPEEQATLLLTALSSFYHPKLLAQHADQPREEMLLRVLNTLLIGMEAHR